MTPDEQREKLASFFLDQLEDLELNTGCNQFARLHALPNAVEEIDKLVNILVGACMSPAFNQIPLAARMSHIADQTLKDPLFASPGYGQVSGFNKAIVLKWLNAVNKNYIVGQSDFQESKTPVPSYDEYLTMCALNNTEPLTEAEYTKPADTDRIGMYMRKIGDIAETMTVREVRSVRSVRSIECKHTGLRVSVSDTHEVCNDCGQEFEKIEAGKEK